MYCCKYGLTSITRLTLLARWCLIASTTRASRTRSRPSTSRISRGEPESAGERAGERAPDGNMADVFFARDKQEAQQVVRDDLKPKIMNEIICESPEKLSGSEDENSFIPETPQKVATSPEKCEKIPIPSLSRIRRSLGVLEDKKTYDLNVLSPTNRRQLQKRSYSSPLHSSRSRKYRKHDLSSLQKVRTSLFSNKHKENRPKEKDFSLNTQSFYGSSEKELDTLALAPGLVAPAHKPTTKKKRSPNSYSLAPMPSKKRLKRGEINCGVKHGIKKPKVKRTSPKNDSFKTDEKNESITVKEEGKHTPNQKQDKKNVSLKTINLENSTSELPRIERYDPTKKFFKHRPIDLKSLVKQELVSIPAEPNSRNFSNALKVDKKLCSDTKTVDASSCENTGIEHSSKLKEDAYTHQYYSDALEPRQENINTQKRGNGYSTSPLNILACAQKCLATEKGSEDLMVSSEETYHNAFKYIDSDKMCENTDSLMNVLHDEMSTGDLIHYGRGIPVTQEDFKNSLNITENSVTHPHVSKTYENLNVAVNCSDIDELLKILDDDWTYESEKETHVGTKSLEEKSNLIFKDVDVALAIENIYHSTIKSSDNVPSLVKDTSNNIENEEQRESGSGEKYYPLFYKSSPSTSCFSETNTQKEKKKVIRRSKNNDEKQLQIDAGQKLIGAIQCKVCKFVYHIGDEDDEIEHLKYHNNSKITKFQGWKSERIVFQDLATNSRIILIEPSDPILHYKKVLEVLHVVDEDLGLSEMELSHYKDKKVYFYIINKTIVGVLVGENVTNAFKMIPELDTVNCCTSQWSPVKCGITFVWTDASHRRQGIATKLLDAMRTTYYYGYVMSIDDIAFSYPTPSGLSFAKKYTKSDNFKIY